MGLLWRDQSGMAQSDMAASWQTNEARRNAARLEALRLQRANDQSFNYENTAANSTGPAGNFTNTGSLGFMRLPIESTTGGFRNNIFDPASNPFPNAPADPELKGLPFNPYTQGYMSGGNWNPYLPDKITLKSPTTNLGPVPGGGQATQWVNGKQVNVGTNNYAAGTSASAPYQFGTAPGDARMEQAPPMNGFHFGQVGQPGYKFMAGSMEGGKFYADQPASLNPAPDKNLGIFRPWNPALDALQKYRSQT